MPEYKTVKQSGTDEFTEKRSRFIGNVRPVKTEKEAQAFVAEITRRHRDARHTAYAYLLREGGIKRMSDDGEPQGTAGLPILEVLEKSDVCDACITVTRYFGGVLLGAPGLFRAYSHAAQLAVASGGVVTMEMRGIFTFTADYAFYPKLQNLLPQLSVTVTDTEFTDRVRLTVSVPQTHETAFCEKVFDASGGQVTPKKICEKFAEK